ncbi:hypothetical protein RFI_28647 [Reticulomyxa filosa]|uniref:Voltage-dependent L-type calcium channel IQ-associated domain-containing protein n=1 Tax=Reticulomyxa filosa TaxID=46433 RepID=X6M6T7_RETFI|nr:hypothetical protein RFI_28647 [Reticulomyxa filosa]|eukprot:ETO08740.1 hypothetical protein RFI_28647 [Reticulomyxa filosa]
MKKNESARDESKQEDEDTSTNSSAQVLESHLAQFVEAWSWFDPMATERVSVGHIYDLLQKVPLPLGIGESGTGKDLNQLLKECEIGVQSDNTIIFHELLYALCERMEGCYVNEDCKIVMNIHKRFYRKFSILVPNTPTLRFVWAVTRVQRAWKKRLLYLRAKKKMNLSRRSIVNASLQQQQENQIPELNTFEKKLEIVSSTKCLNVDTSLILESKDISSLPITVVNKIEEYSDPSINMLIKQESKLNQKTQETTCIQLTDNKHQDDASILSKKQINPCVENEIEIEREQITDISK